MHTFITFLLRQRWFVIAATLLLCVAGWIGWTRLPIDAFPDVTNVQVMVLTEAPGLSAADVEQQVTYPIEQQMGGVPRVTQVRSLSKAGLSQVIVVFEDDTDIYFARQQVFERLQGAKEQLPAGVEPELGPISTGLGEIFQYTLESATLSPMELRGHPGLPRGAAAAADPRRERGQQLRRLRQAVPRARARPTRCSSTTSACGTSWRRWRATTPTPPAASSSAAGNRPTSAASGRSPGSSDIREVVLKVAERDAGARPRRGRRRRRPADPPGRRLPRRQGRGGRRHGDHAPGGELQGRRDRASRRPCPRIQKSLPPGVALNVFYDRTDLIEACIETVVDALLEGGIFVILVLFLFLAELRTALIVVASLPMTFLATFLIMGCAGISSNLMSLGGLAFSVGMVVDASIVIVENMRRHFGERRDPGLRRQIAIEAISEVARPVGVLGADHRHRDDPAVLAAGDRGQDVRPAGGDDDHRDPRLAGRGADDRAGGSRRCCCEQAPEKEFRIVQAVHRGYLALLGRRPQGALGDAGALRRGRSSLAGFAATRIGTEFMPNLDEGAIAINVVRLPNASLEGSVSVSAFMERRLREASPR